MKTVDIMNKKNNFGVLLRYISEKYSRMNCVKFMEDSFSPILLHWFFLYPVKTSNFLMHPGSIKRDHWHEWVKKFEVIVAVF